MQRILHITGTMDRAGAETMIMNLYRKIDRTKIQFDFVFFSDKKADYESEILKMGGKIYRILESNPISRIFALKKLLSLHSEYKIVHSHTLLSSGFHLLAARLANVKHRIAHAHSSNDIRINSKFELLYKTVVLKLIKNFTTTSIACGKHASAFLFPNKSNVILLPNSIDTEKFASIAKLNKDYWKSKFDLDEGVLKIIQVGRIQEVKNHKFSLKIAKKLREKNINFKMLFVGQGELSHEIGKQIKDSNLSNEVVLLGLRTDIPELMAGADVMLMPSLHEGFPVVLVESQAVGLTAVISNTISSEVDLGLNLIEFEDLEESIESWIDKLRKAKMQSILEQENRIMQLEEKGFDVKSNAKRLVALYNSLY